MRYWFGIAVSTVPPLGLCLLGMAIGQPGPAFLLGMLAGAVAFVGGMISGAA